MKQLTNRKLFMVVVGFLLAALIVPVVYAQETTAGITGYIKDPTGAVVAKATVEITGSALIGKRTAVTDSAGAYLISKLPPGEYTISVVATGFRPYKQSGLDLSAGRLPSLDITLQVGTATETVEVSGEAPLVDVTQSKVAVTVQLEQLDSMPKGRSFQSVIPFAPGARQEPLQGGTTARNNGFQVDGASDSENVYMIDGVNVTNIQNGGVGKNFQMDFIQEVQVKSSSFEAEYGGALGGVVNAVPKRGSNRWHGSVLTYLQSSGLNANDPCATGFTSNGYSTTCGLRLDPATSLSSANRLDGTPEYYVPKKDARRILEPGFEAGGPLLKDRLWLYASYIPSIDTTRRTTTFTGANKGPRTLTNTTTQHNAYTRLDYRALNSLRLYGSWNYAYWRTQGTLGAPDSAFGQRNTGASTDPNTLRSDAGSVNPVSVYTFGGDWTPTSKIVVSARWGYFFNNTRQMGTPTGTRWLYNRSLVINSGSLDPVTGKPTSTNKCTTDINGFCITNTAGASTDGVTTVTSGAFSAPLVNTSGFANIPSTFKTFFDAYKRKSWNADLSYFVGHLWGSHTFKGGYFYQSQSNDVLRTFNGGYAYIDWGTAYTPVTSTSACDAVIAQNVANGWSNRCMGRYGFFTVSDGVDNTGKDTQTAHALYIQDNWNVGHGLTLNLGVRFDMEDQPAYDPSRFPSVHFGFADKTAPRIGGAYDLFRNGKIKIYASYGQFYDIMKMGLARGSFGSDYWHDCVYAMDFTNYTTITPTAPLISVNGGAPAPHGCPPTGSADGVTVGRFIENVDFRATHADPRDPAIQPNMKPMKQHEFVTGVDWAITPNWSLETRYSRKRLDNTIEDMSITDNLGFYIGNPGTPFADLLHRQIVIDPAAGSSVPTVGPICAECPPVVPAIRRYDGVEFRLSKRPTGKWFGAVTYTYSKLTGNYPGLTNTDPTDGGGGRHSPNNSRLFDLPNMTYLANGKIDDGPLSTDRPHTAKVFGYYRLKWWKRQETLFGFIQSAFQGTPINTCLSVIGTGSACQWATGRGRADHFSRAANGDFVLNGTNPSARTSPFFQTDFSIAHEISVSKDNENMKLRFEANILNLLNNRSGVSYNENVLATGLISPKRASRFTGDPKIDWGKVMNGFDYTQEMNAESLTLASRYGLAQVFQGARNMRLAVRFVF